MVDLGDDVLGLETLLIEFLLYSGALGELQGMPAENYSEMAGERCKLEH